MTFHQFSLALAAVLVVFASLGMPSAIAEEKHHPAGSQQATPTDTLTDGEVRKVDKDAKKITIKHGPITNLDMPAMTMVFQVKDPALLDQVNAGDKVKFVADKIGSAYVVIRFEAPK